MDSLAHYKQLLKPFIAFESISTDPAHSEETARTAAWLSKLFSENGFKVQTWDRPGQNPVVYARYDIDTPDADSVLVYGHYDVQPASKDDGWYGDPFRLEERAGKLYGRGVVDNKGQVLIHIASVFQLIKAGWLAHNVAFIIEGDEESGGGNMRSLLQKHKNTLQSDYILISDGEIPYRPTIEVGVRGSFNLEIVYTTASNDLHSGIFGGGVPNAGQELSKLIASFYDDNHRVTLPGFYDGVDEVTKSQKEAGAALFKGTKRLREITGVKELVVQDGYDYVTATGLTPSLEVTGIQSGYTGSGFANIVPGEARANFNIRTVSSQNSQLIAENMIRAINDRTPAYVDARVEVEGAGDAIKLPTDTPVIRHLQRLLEDAYGTKPLFSYCGGTMPIVEDFKTTLGKESLLVSLGNDDCNMHGANENFDLGLIKKALNFSRLFFSKSI